MRNRDFSDGILAAIVISSIACGNLFGSEGASSRALLQSALEHARAFNWSDAGPDFHSAQLLFNAEHDPRNALYARVGWLRATMESSSLMEVRHQLQDILNLPAARRDEELLLFASIAKADVDGELNALDAKDDWLAIQALATTNHDDLWANRAKGELSFSEFLTGNISNGRVLLAGALEGAKKNGDFAGQIRYITAVGAALDQIRSFDQASVYLDKALALSRQYPITGFPFVTYEYKLDSLIGLKQLDRAELLANQIIREAHKRDKKVKEAQALLSLARIKQEVGDFEAAVKALTDAAHLAEVGHFTRFQADTQFRLADIYRQQGNLRTAESYLTTGLSLTEDTPEIWLMPTRLRTLAQLKIDNRKYREAGKIYQRASDLIDVLLGSTTNPEAKRSMIATNSEIYVEHFQLAADHLQNLNEAYSAVEEGRGRTSLDMLRGALPPTSPRTAVIDDTVSRLRQSLVQAKTEKQRVHLKNAVFQEEQQRWSTDVRSDESVPRFAEILPLTNVRSRLADDEAILEYVMGERQVYCLAITKASARIVRLTSTIAVEKKIKLYMQQIESLEEGKKLGHELYSMLLQQLPEVTAKSRLLIVRDGQLHLLPWDALVDDSGNYLVESKNITFAPSVSTAILLRDRPAVNSPSVMLAVGGLPYDQTGLQASLRTSNPTAKLGNIPGSRDEVQDAAKLFRSQHRNVDLLLDADGTKAAFKKAVQTKHEIIHMAVHASSNAKDPDHAALYLLGDKKTGTDGILDAAEVLSLSIRTNVVVLSACETAVGRFEGQEGVANLSRAFLMAGSHSVISTLWSIDDTFSRFLMNQFYVGLAAGTPAGDALRTAKLEIIRTFGPTAVPFRWAAYTLEGAGNISIPPSAAIHE